jgi:hypothetical protein
MNTKSGGSVKKIFVLAIVAAVFCLSASVVQTKATTRQLSYRIKFPGNINETGDFSELIADPLLWSTTTTHGAPALPGKTLHIAVPPAGDLKISTRIVSQTNILLDLPLLPVPTIIPAEKSSEFIYQINNDLYSEAGFNPVHKGEAFMYRGYRLIPVTIYPCSYNHITRSLLIRKDFEIDIEILGNTNWRQSYPDEKPWLDREFIANYPQARYWRTPFSHPPGGINWENSQFWFRIDINSAGKLLLTASDLGILPEFADHKTLRLFALQPQAGDSGDEISFVQQEIPLYIGDDFICFEHYGEGNILWLALAGTFTSPAKRLQAPVDHPQEIKKISIKTPRIRSNRAIECLLIRPDGYFESAADDLAEFNFTEYGVETAIVIQEDIFAYESGGIAESAAIKNYLADFYSDNSSLEYVILMGSGTSNFEYPTSKNKIITYYRSSIISDDFFVDFNADNRPDLVIGRIPAQSESMMDKYLQNMHSYHDNFDQGWWQNRILLLADDENKSGGMEGFTPSSGMNHTARMEDTIEVLQGRITRKIYGIEYPFDAYQSKPGATQDIISNLNEGAMVFYYIGHGSWDNLGDEDYFSLGDIQLLSNNSHLTHFLAGSCNVGNYTRIGSDCIAEVLLFSQNGGAISSLASTIGSSPLSNYQLLRAYLYALYNLNMNIGRAVYYAKYNSDASTINSASYNILGNPVIKLPIPARIGNISGLPDSLLHRQIANYSGDFGDPRLDTIGHTIASDSEQLISYTNFIPPDTSLVFSVDYYRSAKTIYRAEVEIEAGHYSAAYIVSDDAAAGNRGSIITLAHNDDGSWLNARNDIVYADSSLDVANDDAPQVSLFLDSRSFRSGDTVSDKPLLIADIYDESGINVSGSPGRSILVLIDDSNEIDDLIDVTTGFIYDPGSYVQGTLSWQFPQMSGGSHNLKLIVYDNFGMPAVAETDFRVAEKNSLAISDLLPYPNPMSKEGLFTFVLTEAATFDISIYTMTGRKINTVSGTAGVGYNQVPWDCRDKDGDRLANNTYFYKLKARSTLSGNSSEATGKLIILH